jgi:hypothetical protein
MGMLETGVEIPVDDINALEGEIMQLIKGKLNENQRKEFANQVV